VWYRYRELFWYTIEDSADTTILGSCETTAEVSSGTLNEKKLWL